MQLGLFEKQKEPMRLETRYQRLIDDGMNVLEGKDQIRIFCPCRIKEHRIQIEAYLISRPGYLWAVGKLPNIVSVFPCMQKGRYGYRYQGCCEDSTRQCAFAQSLWYLRNWVQMPVSACPMWSFHAWTLYTGPGQHTPSLEKGLSEKTPPPPRPARRARSSPNWPAGPSPQHAPQRHKSTKTPFPPSPPTRSPPGRACPGAPTPHLAIRLPRRPA